jgi:hypothetical protein
MTEIGASAEKKRSTAFFMKKQAFYKLTSTYGTRAYGDSPIPNFLRRGFMFSVITEDLRLVFKLHSATPAQVKIGSPWFYVRDRVGYRSSFQNSVKKGMKQVW